MQLFTMRRLYASLFFMFVFAQVSATPREQIIGYLEMPEAAIGDGGKWLGLNKTNIHVAAIASFAFDLLKTGGLKKRAKDASYNARLLAIKDVISICGTLALFLKELPDFTLFVCDKKSLKNFLNVGFSFCATGISAISLHEYATTGS